MAVNPVLDRDKALSYEIDRQDGEITLAEFTAKGIELIDNPNGFFMMVEGGKIDWACHANDAVASIRDTIAFDDAVRVALDFYKKHQDETLVVVLADHETGGMSIGFAGTQYDTFFSKLRFQKGSYLAFDAFLAEYKKAHQTETAKFDDIAAKITEFFGFRFLSDEKLVDLESKAKGGDSAAAQELELAVKPREMKELRSAFEQTMKGAKERSSDEETYLLYGEYEPLTISLTHILNRKAGIGWTTYAHTGVPVPVSAIGVGQETFNGYYDNTDVHAKMKAAMGL